MGLLDVMSSVAHSSSFSFFVKVMVGRRECWTKSDEVFNENKLKLRCAKLNCQCMLIMRKEVPRCSIYGQRERCGEEE